MSARMCAFGSGLRHGGCHREAMRQCHYCSRPFCDEHSQRDEDDTRVCAGRRCQQQLADVRELKEWRARVAAANRRDECAIETCLERMRQRCARCRLQFCQAHVRFPDARKRPLKVRITGFIDRIIHYRGLTTIGSAPGGRPELLMGNEFRAPTRSHPSNRRAVLMCTHCAELVSMRT